MASEAGRAGVLPERLTLFQRMVLRRLRRQAGRKGAEPLSSEDWPLVWALHHRYSAKLMHKAFKALPSSPRCCQCGAPFASVGRLIVQPLGYRPSRKNPHYCATCVELSPPGGTTMMTGVLFADIRGFTAASEHANPESVSRILRRFYGCVEDVVFPEAIIDKLIGDQVMVLYLSAMLPNHQAPALMVDHALSLLREVGYGSADGPFVEIGIGIDYGEAFVGNIGDRSVHDFTAVGDVVNTASRLQGLAAGGELLLSDRVAAYVDSPIGERVELELRGKDELQIAYRLRPTP